MLIFGLLLACGESQPEALPLTKEFYKWTCHDYEDMSEVVISTNTCEDYDTGLHWLVAESYIAYSSSFKRKLDKTENWAIDCLYQTEIPLMDHYCIEVEGVTLTAFVDSPSWSGVFLGD